jgi:hypothetical protein|tara:strand:+ start:691 stop:801 length:111 start_codon:yes stop_codon:yes gene_type:complete
MKDKYMKQMIIEGAAYVAMLSIAGYGVVYILTHLPH